ncbi:MAG: hypothetical protein WD063_05545 [Pirellulales bacterium]
MARSAEAAAREAKIAELKRLITAGTYETLEKLEEAVDAFLWSEQDRVQAEQPSLAAEMVRSHPK